MLLSRTKKEQPKPIVTNWHALACAWHVGYMFLVTASFDWLTGLFECVLCFWPESVCFDFGKLFMILSWHSLQNHSDYYRTTVLLTFTRKHLESNKTYCSLQRIHLAREKKGENFCSKVAMTTLSTNWTPNSACRTKRENKYINKCYKVIIPSSL